jgi:hypothetical protein
MLASHKPDKIGRGRRGKNKNKLNLLNATNIIKNVIAVIFVTHFEPLLTKHCLTRIR